MLQIPAGASRGTINELQLLTSENQVLTSAMQGNFYANYVPVPPASYNFVVRNALDPGQTLRKLPILLRPDTYITIVATTRDNQPVVEMVDDTVDPKTITTAPGQLTVRQFIPGAKVKVTAERVAATDELDCGQTALLDNLPVRALPLTLQITQAGKPLTLTTVVDFAAGRHATLLVVMDPYGRVRSRLTVDGEAGDAPTIPVPRTPMPPRISPIP